MDKLDERRHISFWATAVHAKTLLSAKCTLVRKRNPRSRNGKCFASKDDIGEDVL